MNHCIQALSQTLILSFNRQLLRWQRCKLSLSIDLQANETKSPRAVNLSGKRSGHRIRMWFQQSSSLEHVVLMGREWLFNTWSVVWKQKKRLEQLHQDFNCIKYWICENIVNYMWNRSKLYRRFYILLFPNKLSSSLCFVTFALTLTLFSILFSVVFHPLSALSHPPHYECSQSLPVKFIRTNSLCDATAECKSTPSICLCLSI